MGLLSGKYRPSEGALGAGRLQTVNEQTAGRMPPGFDKLTERNFRIVAELEAVARDAGRPMAQVALNWLYNKRGVSSIIVGATKPEQLEGSLASLDFALAPELVARLDAVSEPARPFPYYMFADGHQARIHGHVEVASKPRHYDAAVTVPAPGTAV